MSPLSRHRPTDDIDAWLHAMDASVQQRTALDLYTAIFAVNFLAEFGLALNRRRTSPVSMARVGRIQDILKGLMKSAAGH